MVTEKILRILEITLPIFALIGLGKLLAKRDILKKVHLEFINWLVAFICLPALVFREIVTKDFSQLANPALIIGALLPTLILFGLMLGLALALGKKGAMFGVLLASGYWANTAYIGFPLAESAYGSAGLTSAAVLNAFAMPVFVISGSLFMAIFSGRCEDDSVPARIKTTLKNPVILASFTAIAISFLVSAFDAREIITGNEILKRGSVIFLDTLGLAGRMGLPLALMAVGTAIRLSTIRASKGMLFTTCVAKLFVAPLLTYLCLVKFFPGTELAARNTAVLLMGTPTAVAFAIISRNLKAEPDFTAAMLVLTTLGSLVTIPLWLYFLL